MSKKYGSIGYEGGELGWADVSAPIEPTELDEQEKRRVWNNQPVTASTWIEQILLPWL